MTAILHTYVGSSAACTKAKNFLRRRNVLSKTTKIKHGHYKFELIVPHSFNEQSARKALSEAFAGEHIEPAVWTPSPSLTPIDDARARELADPRPLREQDRDPKPVIMHERIKEQCDLAHFYAQDGAYHSAARVLTELAAEVRAHAERNTALMEQGAGDPKTRALMDRATK